MANSPQHPMDASRSPVAFVRRWLWRASSTRLYSRCGPSVRDRAVRLAHQVYRAAAPEAPISRQDRFSIMRAIIPADDQILLLTRDRAAFGFLSNFHPAKIRLDEETWPSAEHYYQAQKSSDSVYRNEIRNAASPVRAKQLAAPPHAPRGVFQRSWFRRHGSTMRPALGRS
jgi:hypothetical protein